MNEAREGEDSCAVQLTECCCGEGNSAFSRERESCKVLGWSPTPDPHRGSQSTQFFWACPEYCELVWRPCIYTELQPKAMRAPS